MQVGAFSIAQFIATHMRSLKSSNLSEDAPKKHNTIEDAHWKVPNLLRLSDQNFNKKSGFICWFDK